MNSSISIFLNITRWFAAFLVVIGHGRYLILTEYKNVEHKTLLTKAIYFSTGFGHEAVVIFFVISGYLVGGLSINKWKKSGPRISEYFISRFSRIYVVLVPALIVGFALDQIGMHWFNASELYTNAAQYHNSVHGNISADLTTLTFIGNIFMLQNIKVGTLGSNAPLWSLANEWWYYCLFALIAPLFLGDKKTKIAPLLISLYLVYLLPIKLLLWGGIWLLGIAANSWIESKLWRPSTTVGLIIFFIALFGSRISHNTDNSANHESLLIEFFRDFVLGCAYVIALASATNFKIPRMLINLNEYLAEFSYSTYLFHFPAMLLVVAIGFQYFGMGFGTQPTSTALTYLICVILFIYLYCFFLSYLSEKNTSRFRKFLFMKLHRSK